MATPPNSSMSVAKWLEYFDNTEITYVRHPNGKVDLVSDEMDSVVHLIDDPNAEHIESGLRFDCADHAINFIRAYC